MRGICCWLGLIAAAHAAPGLAQIRTTELDAVSQPQPVDSATQAQDIPIGRDGNDRMTVAVRLAGSGPYRFLVDTGADRTAISTELVARHGLAAGVAARLHSATGVSLVRTALVPSLQLDAADLRIVDAPVLHGANMGADGILGVDSLRAQRLMFDFRAKTMTIVPARQKIVAEEQGTIVVRARERNGRLVVTSAEAQGQRVQVVLDTGSEVTIANHALRKKLMGRGQLQRQGKVMIESVTGQTMAGDYMILEKLEIGGVTLTNLAIVFADAHTFRTLKLSGRPALLLGMNALRAFDKVSIDFGNRKFRVLMPEHSALSEAVFAER